MVLDIIPEIGKNCYQRAHLYQHIEWKFLFGRNIPAKEKRRKNQVPRAGDGQKFGYSLDDAEDKGL
jgi:hypothetical protein